jgi:hypothetical protein
MRWRQDDVIAPLGPTATIRRFLRPRRLSAFTIKPLSVALSGRWPVGRSLRSTICRGPVGSQGSPSRPRPGSWTSPAAGQGLGLSARTVDDAPARPPWTRARTGGGPRLPSSGWRKARCATSSTSRRSSRTKCARRDPDFKTKMAEVRCVYRELKLIKETAAAKREPSDAVAIISYDEKPGIQAPATTAPDLPPAHARLARDHEYKRHGTVSLLAGIDLLTGQIHALVRNRHRTQPAISLTGTSSLIAYKVRVAAAG